MRKGEGGMGRKGMKRRRKGWEDKTREEGRRDKGHAKGEKKMKDEWEEGKRNRIKEQEKADDE